MPSASFERTTPEERARAPWMRFAWDALQHAAIVDHRARPYAISHQPAQELEPDDEGTWCSAFVNWCLSCGGQRGTGRTDVRPWLEWGEPLAVDEPLYGCIAVFARPPRTWEGHVGFFIGADADFVYVLGKSRSSVRICRWTVCIKAYPWSRWLAYRWPLGQARSGRTLQPSAAFEPRGHGYG